jgi:hypothetical protein
MQPTQCASPFVRVAVRLVGKLKNRTNRAIKDNFLKLLEKNIMLKDSVHEIMSSASFEKASLQRPKIHRGTDVIRIVHETRSLQHCRHTYNTMSDPELAIYHT